MDAVSREGLGSQIKELIILPIPTTRDGVRLSGTALPLSSIVEDVRLGTAVTGYGIPEAVAEQIKDRGGVSIDCEKSELFLKENARLTAEAALGIVLSEGGKAPRDMKIGVVGYGRIGKELTRLMLFIGAKTVVYTSDGDTLLDLCIAGVEARRSEPSANVCDLDLLMNTAPKRIFELPSEGTLPLFDLASGNFYKDYRGVRTLPSLPAKCFPESAARVWHKAILAHLGASKA